MPFWSFPSWCPVEYRPEQPAPCHGKRRGVTKSPKRAKRRNRRKA